MENENNEMKKAEGSGDNKMLVPGAIILAGLIIAGAVVYAGLPKSQKAITDPSLLGGGAQAPEPPADVKEILKVSSEDFVQGNPASKVLIIEYGDFQCPFLRKVCEGDRASNL